MKGSKVESSAERPKKKKNERQEHDRSKIQRETSDKGKRWRGDLKKRSAKREKKEKKKRWTIK